MNFYGLSSILVLHIFLAFFVQVPFVVQSADSSWTVPGPPASVDLTVLTGETIQVNFTAPLSDGGAPVSAYKVEWDTDPGTQEIQTVTTSTFTGPNEIQSITTSAPDINEIQQIRTTATLVREVQTITTYANPGATLAGTGSQFTVTLDTTPTGGSQQTSGVIAYNAAPQVGTYSLYAILQYMSNIGNGGIYAVTRSGPDAQQGYTWTVTFAARMGNVPQLTLGSSSLTGTGANIQILTVTDGNVIGGSYKLSFGGFTTPSIQHTASDFDLQQALQSLPSIGSLDVFRQGPDYQGGYTWTVTFTSNTNAGNIPAMQVAVNSLTGVGTFVNVTTIRNGNSISGKFNITFNKSTVAVNFDSSAPAMQTALQKIGTGIVYVTRDGPDFQSGYSWTISFVQLAGVVPLLTTSHAALFGVNSAVTVQIIRKGTIKEVQTITTTTTNTKIRTSTRFKLNYQGQITGFIYANPNNGSCDPSLREIQVITTSTTDATGSGGFDHVSSLTVFAMIFSNNGQTEQTNFIKANPAGGDCSVPAKLIQQELQSLYLINGAVSVSFSSRAADQTCTWKITFSSLPGNLDQMELVTSSDGPSSSVESGDDTMSIFTLQNGTYNAIKYELEKLANIGTVTVTPSSASQKTCTWRVTFETNTGTIQTKGSLPYLKVALAVGSNVSTNITKFSSSATYNGDTVSICRSPNICVNGTSIQLGGQFALGYNGQRTYYFDSDISARDMKIALESLSTVGTVDVTRSLADENLGYTWSVTFLTNLGPLPLITFDSLALTGTVPTIEVAVYTKGIFPPFNSLDRQNGLSLGSTTLTDVQDLSIDVSNLNQGIAYYFRVSAANSLGYGDAQLSGTPYAVPMPQIPSAPNNVILSVLDDQSLRVSFDSPSNDGGNEIDRFRVEYANQAFADEVQSVQIICNITNEVQLFRTSAKVVPEVQAILLTTTYSGSSKKEIQSVTCDASGGSFALIFNGQTTAPINYNANSSFIQAALQQLASVSAVGVQMVPHAVACMPSYNLHPFNVTFYSVKGIQGNMPLMQSDVSLLQGNRRVLIQEVRKGQAGLSGTYQLTFRGSTTQPIPVNASALDVQTYLSHIDSIPYSGGVIVSSHSAGLYSKFYLVTFVGSTVTGNVEAMQVYPANNNVMGNDASISILTDGATNHSLMGSFSSVRGNQLSGTFRLSLLGHWTDNIDYNVDETTLKHELELLPNIGTVLVDRSGPTGQLGFNWSVTFLSNPGAFPPGSGDIALLNSDCSKLGGTNVTCALQEVVAGSTPLDGSFQLEFSNGLFYNVSGSLFANAEADEVKQALEQLPTVGTVDVQRQTNTDGYTWFITFSACRTDSATGVDICNIGDLLPLKFNSSSLIGGKMVVAKVIPGSGPAACTNNLDALCQDYVTDLSSGQPYTYDITGLVAGQPYYVRVSAHTLMSYGTSQLSSPLYAIPSFKQPGPPPPVRLVSSTSTSITLTWDKPTENGGSVVTGYELWMDDWAGGNFRVVYDGLDYPNTFVFTVSTFNSPGLESGRRYRFQVRAINYCSSTNSLIACYGAFSDPVDFTVRNPLPPQPPPQPMRDSASTIGGPSAGDAVVWLHWSPPIDNGGSAITAYNLFMKTSGGTLTQITLPTPVPFPLRASVSNLLEGQSYLFYVQAVNARGTSGMSPPTDIIASVRPGQSVFGKFTYAQTKPTLLDVSSTSVTLSWNEPLDTGLTPITGYRVYSFPGVDLNSQAVPEPVKLDIQEVISSVDDPQIEVQQIVILNAASGLYNLFVTANALGGKITNASIELKYNAGSSDMQSALRKIKYLGQVTVFQAKANLTASIFDVTFTGYIGPVSPIVVDITRLGKISAALVPAASVTRIVKGTEPLQGTFTLSFRGYETVPLAYNISAQEMARQLMNLRSIGLVTVSRNISDPDGDLQNWGAYKWYVTFWSELGNLESLYATPGRLTGGNPMIQVTPVKPQAGSTTQIVYDGFQEPNIRQITVQGLTSGQSYAFKVLPFNAIGAGVASGATATIIAHDGASATQTTAKGGALSTGIAGVVFEQQKITVKQALHMYFMLLLPPNWINETVPLFSNASASTLEGALENIGIGQVHVTSSSFVVSGSTYSQWTVTFLEMIGDIPTLSAIVHPTSASVTIVEFVKGAANSFIIEPKKASGAVVQDVDSISTAGSQEYFNFSGEDTFFTEIWKNNGDQLTWESDGGVATYNPVQYEIQRLFIPNSASGQFHLSFDLTSRLDGTVCTTGNSSTLHSSGLQVGSTALQMKEALELCPNIHGVDVSYNFSLLGGISGHSYFITFTDDFGDLPLLTYTGSVPHPLSHFLNITEMQKGVTELQTVIVTADTGFVREIQSIAALSASGAVGGNMNITLSGASNYVLVSSTAPADAVASGGNGQSMQERLQTLSNVVQVSVERILVPSDNGIRSNYMWLITFFDPVGDVPTLQVSSSHLTGSSPRVDVVEVIKGHSPLSGTFTLSYLGEYTNDLYFDASAEIMKETLEDLPSIYEVDVHRDDLGNGYRWWVTFVSILGDLPEMVPYPYRWEIQSVQTIGGNPTPLEGAFTLSYGGQTSALISFDASAETMKATLEALSTVGRVDVERYASDWGQREWLITFRALIGNLDLLVADFTLLTGSNALCVVQEIVQGLNTSLNGNKPHLEVNEETAGFPSYTGSYIPQKTGSYSLDVVQLIEGGLRGEYFDNRWLIGPSAQEVIDPTIQFNWGTGLITKYGRDYVSVRWSGKLYPLTTEIYTLYLFADNGARLFLDHILLIDSWESCCDEQRAVANLTQGSFHDLVVEYYEETGAASIWLQWSSYSIKKQVIPPQNLFFSQHIVGSPFDITVIPGAADYPYTTATGLGLTTAVAGLPASFDIQTKDALGNIEMIDMTVEETQAFDISMIQGSLLVSPGYIGMPQYSGSGVYNVSYTALLSGNYSLSIKMGGTDIYCGMGQDMKCSPFNVTVYPAETRASSSEAQGSFAPAMDELVEAAAGDSARFMIQAKDVYGNNQWVGNDVVTVVFTLQSDNNIMYRGIISDYQNGSYGVLYTIPTAGLFTVSIRIGDDLIRSCTPPPVTLVTQRHFNGSVVYVPPPQCTLSTPTLKVVHGDLYPPACTAVDGPTFGLSHAFVGVTNTFTIYARDEFGNLRSGQNTTHFKGYGDGMSDAFLVTFSGPDGYQLVTSSAVQVITLSSNSLVFGHFRVSYEGMISLDLPRDISPAALQTVLATMNPNNLRVVRVDGKTVGSGYTWSVTFLSHLDQYSASPLTLLAGSDGDTSLFNLMKVTKVASAGLYPVQYTLWVKGIYTVSVTVDGEHITGSEFTVTCDTGKTTAATSQAYGKGLVGGVAGEQLSVVVQARDVRQAEKQTILITAPVVPVVPEVQTVSIPSGYSGSLILSYGGQNTSQIPLGATGSAAVKTSLQALFSIQPGIVDVSGTVAAGSTFSVTFTSVYGDVSMLKVNHGSVAEKQKGDAPFRKEVQSFTCTSTHGQLQVSFQGLSTKPFLQNTTLATFKSRLYSDIGLNVTFRSASATVCNPSSQPKPVFVTFENMYGNVDFLMFTFAVPGSGNVLLSEIASGIHPFWGKFSLSFAGATTSLIDAFAPASTVQAALQSLPTIGGVSVQKHMVGLSEVISMCFILELHCTVCG